MLCDDYLANLAHAAEGTPAAVRPLFEIMQAQRFVLSPQTVATIDSLADPVAVETMRDNLFAPAEITWLEWRGGEAGFARSTRHGLFLEGAQTNSGSSIFTGHGHYACDVPGFPVNPIVVPIVWDLPEGNLLSFRMADTKMWAIIDKFVPEIRNMHMAHLGAWMATAFALINTPRIANIRFEDRAKLNRAREKSRKPPVLSWSEVSIKLDAGTPGHGDQRTQTGERALHHVRSFFRLKAGKVEIVRPHWRGNPEIGVKRHRYIVSRAEDEAGEWRGGPLPCPQIIKELS